MSSAAILQALKDQYSGAIIDESHLLGEDTIEVNNESLKDVLAFLKNSPLCQFKVLMDLTGVDYLEPVKRTKVVYLLHNPSDYSRMRITVFVERGGELPSVVDLWCGADWYERELFDLFGVLFKGHPDLKRILMPDDWQGHPLRRDYALTEVPVEFKNGVHPKVPSQVIGSN